MTKSAITITESDFSEMTSSNIGVSSRAPGIEGRTKEELIEKLRNQVRREAESVSWESMLGYDSDIISYDDIDPSDLPF